MPDPLTTAYADRDAVDARAFRHLIRKGRLTQHEIDEAKDWGRSELKTERIRAQVAEQDNPADWPDPRDPVESREEAA